MWLNFSPTQNFEYPHLNVVAVYRHQGAVSNTDGLSVETTVL